MKKIAEMADTRCGWYLITPDDAEGLLRRMGKNRPLREARVARITADIKSGLWSPNGESVVVAHDGELMDGQHRLRACVTAGLAIVAFVVYLPKGRVDEHVFDTIDIGAPRGASDRLAMDGAEYHAMCAALCRQAILYGRFGWIDASGGRGGERGKSPNEAHVTIADIREFYRHHRKEVDEAAGATAMFQRMLSGWATPSMVAFVYMQGAKHDQKKADAWLHGLATGENLTGDSPILKLRRRLQDQAVTRNQLLPKVKAALMVHSWNDYASGGAPRKQLGFRPDYDKFPSFYGLPDVLRDQSSPRRPSGETHTKTRAAARKKGAAA